MDERKKTARLCVANTITHRCNMNCKLCATGVPYYKTKYHPTFDFFNRVTERLFCISDFDIFEFEGGEPLLRRDLAEILNFTSRWIACAKQFRFVTNGTIMPGHDVLCALEKYGDKFFVIIDNYGGSEDKSTDIKSALSNRGIPCEIRDYTKNSPYSGGWVDWGLLPGRKEPFKTEPELTKQARKHFGECLLVGNRLNNIVIDGILCPCPRQFHLRDFHGIYPKDGEFIDLFGTNDISELKERFQKLYSLEYLEACGYCNGFTSGSTRYTPAEQLIGGELFP